MTRAYRFAIYSQDGMGLGHLRRNTLIGQKILEAAPGSNILLIADSPVAPFFRLPAGMDFIKLPSIQKIGPGQWQPALLQSKVDDVQELRSLLLSDVLKVYRPDLLLVDHMPVGAKGELTPALETLRKAHPGCVVVLGLRDILDAREVIARVWQKEGAYEALRNYYDRVLIYGSSQVFDSLQSYHLPVPSKGIHYCGYVVNPGPVKPASQIRQTLLAGNRKMVFVSAGGGHDGYLLMKTYLQALRLMDDCTGILTLMAVGVNLPMEMLQELVREAQGLPVQVLPHVDDSLSHIAAADLVVCMAGYNTLSEVLSLRKRALVVPRNGPSEEQRMRAGLFARRGLLEMLDPRDLTPEVLAKRLKLALQNEDPSVRGQAIEMNGAGRAAGRLLELLD
ncbi:MAG TPA: glycosyltransferase [Candidatus Acidoferrales bacterium]|nr:glycosyltransferase [Candidatus Acidoferrales bacterium]